MYRPSAPASSTSTPTGAPGSRPTSAAIVAIGDEVVRGETVATNGAFLAERLSALGLEVREHAVVTDDPADIRAALVRLRTEVDVIVATGGLGPTTDDRTVDVLCALLGREAVTHEASLSAMKERFQRYKFELTPNNLRQVRVPALAEALPNPAGLAPGFCLALPPADAFFLPGVPREMTRIFEEHVVPRLAARLREAGRPGLHSRVWHVYGVGESHIDHRLADLLDGTDGATLHFRTEPPQNHVQVIVRGDRDQGRAALDRLDVEIRRRLGPAVYGVDGDTFVGTLGRALRAAGTTLALAESCTGGLAGHLLCSEAGASEFFRGSVVAYTNDVKTGVLGVRPETLAAQGAVSEIAAREMAEGARRVLGSNLAISVTGIAGPDGGTTEKPVGTACFGVAREGASSTRTATRHFPGDREAVRRAAAFFALDLARQAVAGKGAR